jgi:redox-sensitive bicupin YhaK (pirin superfamily)
MLDGHMQHQDNHGNVGDLGPGDVQWMSAASGIIHSEMPQQSEGRMRGFQLWLNLPAKEKMKPAAYRDIPSGEIPVVGNVKVIAGEYHGTRGPIHGGSTDPYYLDVELKANEVFEASVPGTHNAFVYVYEGEATIGGKQLPHRAAGLLSEGEKIVVEGKTATRFLVLAGKPLREPVVQHGPFVMNTREEIDQAIRDYQGGRFATQGIRTLGTGA